nr:hypothetical protein [Tanacetum cinerariifolium]
MATTIDQQFPTGKSSGVDSFRLSQAQILWGLYHRRNVDFAYLIWEDFVYQVEHKNTKRSNEIYYPRFTKVIIDYFMTRKPSIPRRNKYNWHYVRDDVLFSTIKVVSRHHTTQQYGAILPIELTTDVIRNSKVYKEYYACATGEAAPKLKVSARKKKGDSGSSTTPPSPTPTTTVVSTPRLSATAKGKKPSRATTPTEPTDVERTEAEQLKIVLKRSRQETHISQQRGFGTDEGTGSRPGVPDVPSDDSKEELSWNSSDNEDIGVQTKGSEESDNDDGSDEGSDDDNDETVKAARIQEEEEADELYRDVNINQGWGLQVTQNIEDSHVTLTPVNPDGPQESSSMSSFVTSMLNPTSDVGVESIFTTASSSIVFLQTPTPIMTPSTIATITTSGDAPIPPTTISSIILENLPTFNSAFRFDERLSEDERMMIRKDPPLDQTGGLKDKKKEVSMHQLALYLKKQLGVQAELPKGLNLDNCLPVSLLLQRNLCRLPVRWRNLHIRDLARQIDARSSSNELLDTPIDFSNFIMNRLNVDTLTPKLLAGPTYELMRGSCTSLTELEYQLEEPLPLIPDNQGRRVIPFDHFINNDLEYLREARPLGVSHWGRKRQQFYGYAVNRESALDVYSKRRIIAVTKLKIVEWHDYKHLDWILEHCHPEASGRSSTGSGKILEEAQPYEARHVPT